MAHIEFRGRWLSREIKGEHALPSRKRKTHHDDFVFQVSSATSAQEHLESHMFNIAILPQAPEAPKLSLGTSLHMTVSWMGGLMFPS